MEKLKVGLFILKYNASYSDALFVYTFCPKVHLFIKIRSALNI